MSLGSFHPTDPPFSNYPSNVQIKNYCGLLGAELSGYTLSGLGLAGLAVILLLGAWGVIFLLKGEIEDLWVRAVGGALLVVSLSLFLGLLGPILPPKGLLAWSGGILGTTASDQLVKNLGLAGTGVFLAFGFFISTVLLFNISLAEGIVGWVRGLKARSESKRPRKSKTPPPLSTESEEEAAAVPAGPLQVPLGLLDEPDQRDAQDEESLRKGAEVLESTPAKSNISAPLVDHETGPAITMYEVELSPGTKVSKVISLSDDIAIAMKAPSIRVVAPLKGRSTVGVEVPNARRGNVRLRELLELTAQGKIDVSDDSVPLLLGRDITGYPIFWDLASMPHLLIAGTTGSGKSVCLNSIILNILFLRSRREVKLLLVDPKMVEFSAFKDIPHLITPVVTDVKEAQAVLEWAVNKMEERYSLLARVGVKNIIEYNKSGEESLKKKLGPSAELDPEAFYLPHVVIIIDELADLMMVASRKVEDYIIRLSQKSRAVGIHLIVSTQRPSVDVVTGLIKSNLPARISFHVASKVDSRTVLDQNGAEKLLGSGDMLFMPPGTTELLRVQGTYVSDEEVRKVVEHLKKQSTPEFSPELKQWKLQAKKEEREDPLYKGAVQVTLGKGRCSEKLLQEELQVSYARAVCLMDQMVEDGILGEDKGGGYREVLLKPEEWNPRPTVGKAKLRENPEETVKK
ncbi:MAG TPA: DNA translocase FtsK [Candidatus Tripitaka californicus]|uniref:DNA translocase FtsK n=1 Tax=Candidatus Tripitaka californicus TaxID=3367616 RepID=UPI004026652E